MSTDIKVVVDNKQLVAAAKELQRQKRLAALDKIRKEFRKKREARKENKKDTGVDTYKKKEEPAARKFGENAVFGGYLIKDWYRNDSDQSTWNAPSLIPTVIESYVNVSCAPPSGLNWATVKTCNLTMARPDYTYNRQGGANYLWNDTYGVSSEFYTLAFPVGDGVSIITVICEVQMSVNIRKDSHGGIVTCWDSYGQLERDIISFRVDKDTAIQINTPQAVKNMIDSVAPAPTWFEGYNQVGQPASFCPTEPSPHPTYPGAFFWPQSFPGGWASNPASHMVSDDEYVSIVSYPSAGSNLAAAYTEMYGSMKWFGPNIFNWILNPHIQADDFFYSPILNDSLALPSDVIVGTYSEVQPGYTFPYYGQAGATDNIIATGNMYDIIGYYGHSIDIRFLWLTPAQRAQVYPNIINAGYSASLNPDLYWSFGYIDHPDTGPNMGKAVGAPFNDVSINGVQISDGTAAYGYTSTLYTYGSFPSDVIEFPCSNESCSEEFTLTEYDEAADYWALSPNRTLPSHIAFDSDFEIEMICVCDLGQDWTAELISIGFDPETIG